MWFAPIPVLIISFNSSGKKTFIIAFIAYLIGRLSWFSYLMSVATIVPAVIFTILIPLIFALIITGTRQIVLKNKSWLAVFAYPVLFTVFEFLVIKFSKDGSAASIAYSQSDFLPVIQIAALTGILGITFIISFIPSAIAVGWYWRKQMNKLNPLIIVSSSIIVFVFLFGIIQLHNTNKTNSIKAGLVVLDERLHDISNHPDFIKGIKLAKDYAQQISMLASQGAQIVVLPERALNINKETDSAVMNILINTAKQDHVYIITGYTNFKDADERNSSLVISADGNVLADYNKVYLVTGLEDQFKPGSQTALFKFNSIQAGTAICKDLDFPGYIKQYGDDDIRILCIPAWDFVTDDWLHSRMAILRGVENGFSEIRTARQGRLTISDSYGKVNAEANSSAGKTASLTGNVSVEKRNTIYSRFGNWFGILNIIAVVFLIFYKRKK
jgi:apolipoprotein N-acyltransferase